MSSNKDEEISTITYDSGIVQEDQNSVTDKLNTKIEDFDFPFYNFDMAQEVPVTGKISVLPSDSANGMTQTDETSYCFDVKSPFNYNHTLVEQTNASIALMTPSASFECDFCGTEISDATIMDNHKKSVHPQESPSFTCSTYGSCFPQVKEMNVHKSTIQNQCFSCGSDVASQTVKDEKSRFVECVDCGVGNRSDYIPEENEMESKSYNLSSEKTTIMKEYYPVKERGMEKFRKPFRCGVCEMQFSQSTHLKDHERIHSGERPFQCEVCDKTFARCSTLKNHQRIHSGEKPYLCDKCGLAFIQASHLKNHTKVHTCEKPNRCDICGGRFRDRYSLKQHEIMRHEKYAKQQSDTAAVSQTVKLPTQELEPISRPTQIEDTT